MQYTVNQYIHFCNILHNDCISTFGTLKGAKCKPDTEHLKGVVQIKTIGQSKRKTREWVNFEMAMMSSTLYVNLLS